MSTTTRTFAAVISSALLAGTVLSGTAAAADEPTVAARAAEEIGAIKAASDPDPFTAEEIATARAESAAKDRKVGLGGIGTMDLPPPPPSSGYLANNHVAQAYNNYCGPATARMTALHSGRNISQATFAKRFGISPNNGGTSWSAMLSALRAYAGNYAGEFLPYSPSSADKTQYKARLKVDIITHRDSIAGNVWEVPGGPHLAGHPKNREIFHWVNIRGYKQSGKYSQVQDPATSVWSGVPANAPVNSDTLVVMMGGRGYQW